MYVYIYISVCVYKPVHQPSQLKLSLGQVLFDPLVSKNANCEPHNSNPLSKGLFDLRRLIWRMHLKARNYRLDATNVMTLCLRLCVCVYDMHDGYMMDICRQLLVDHGSLGVSHMTLAETPSIKAAGPWIAKVSLKAHSNCQYCQCMFQRSISISSFNTLSVSI